MKVPSCLVHWQIAVLPLSHPPSDPSSNVELDYTQTCPQFALSTSLAATHNLHLSPSPYSNVPSMMQADIWVAADFEVLLDKKSFI